MIQYTIPVKHTETSARGANWHQYRTYYKSGNYHNGVDLTNGTHKGDPIYASADGVVYRWDSYLAAGRGYGIYLRDSEGYEHAYFHCCKPFNPGAFTKGSDGKIHVKAGTVIGYVGDTGRSSAVHLHYEVRKDGKWYNPWQMLYGSDDGMVEYVTSYHGATLHKESRNGQPGVEPPSGGGSQPINATPEHLAILQTAYIIGIRESSAKWDSMNPTGSSIGVGQWKNNRARDLLKDIVEIDSSIPMPGIKSLSEAWSGYDIPDSSRQAIKDALKSTAGIIAQKRKLVHDVTYYFNNRVTKTHGLGNVSYGVKALMSTLMHQSGEFSNQYDTMATNIKSSGKTQLNDVYDIIYSAATNKGRCSDGKPLCLKIEDGTYEYVFDDRENTTEVFVKTTEYTPTNGQPGNTEPTAPTKQTIDLLSVIDLDNIALDGTAEFVKEGTSYVKKVAYCTLEPLTSEVNIVYNNDNVQDLPSLGYSYNPPLPPGSLSVPLPEQYRPKVQDRQTYNRLMRKYYVEPINHSKLDSLSLNTFEVLDTDPVANAFRADMVVVLSEIRKRAIADKGLSYLDQYNSKLIIKRGFSTQMNIEGEEYSPHSGGIAADVYAPNDADRSYLKNLAQEFKLGGIGISKDSQYVHIDISSDYAF